MIETKVIPKLYMMVGIVSSGKSSEALNISKQDNAIIHSSDELRKIMFGDVNEVNKNSELFQELHKRIKLDLSKGRNVVYDATNISWKRRRAFLNELRKIECKKIAVIVATPYDECVERNKNRERSVPEYVIRRMYLNFYVPQLYEGFDEIRIKYNTKKFFDTYTLFNGENGLNKIDQETPYHTLTIGQHCIKCSQICEELIEDARVNMAALYHDIGKRFVKEYNEEKKYCTYYQHHLVSAYDSMFYLRFFKTDDLLQILNYIQWHMQPFFLKQEKSVRKFVNLVGQDFYDKLLILHEADKLAK
jgi:predicted kinase